MYSLILNFFNMLTIHYTGPKNEVNAFIKNIKSVLMNLPKNDQVRINDECMIFLIGKTYGFSIGVKNKHLIMLNINEISKNNMSIKEQRFIIAHEFAHFILKHTHSNDENEQEANDLVLKWNISNEF